MTIVVVPLFANAATCLDAADNPVSCNSPQRTTCLDAADRPVACSSISNTNQSGQQSGGNGGSSGCSGGGVCIENPLAANSITEFFLLLIEILLIFAIPIIVFFIILAGFKFVTAQGNESTISEAKRALLYAIIGALLILGANLILAVIQNTVDSFTI